LIIIIIIFTNFAPQSTFSGRGEAAPVDFEGFFSKKHVKTSSKINATEERKIEECLSDKISPEIFYDRSKPMCSTEENVILNLGSEY